LSEHEGGPILGIGLFNSFAMLWALPDKEAIHAFGGEGPEVFEVFVRIIGEASGIYGSPNDAWLVPPSPIGANP
jgi:hypothetical protein